MIFIIAALLCFMCSCEKEKTTGSIYGTVTHRNGEPASGKKVEITAFPFGYNAVTITGSDGYYQFLDLEEDDYKIEVEGVNYTTKGFGVELKAGQSVKYDIKLTY